MLVLMSPIVDTPPVKVILVPMAATEGNMGILIVLLDNAAMDVVVVQLTTLFVTEHPQVPLVKAEATDNVAGIVTVAVIKPAVCPKLILLTVNGRVLLTLAVSDGWG